MRSIISTLLLAGAVTATASAQVSFEGGLALNNLSIKSAGQKVETKFATGGTFGFIVGLQLADHMYFEPGILYQTAGCAYKDPLVGGYSMSTLTFPLDFVYKSGGKCGSRFIIGAGPYVAQILSGTYSIERKDGTFSYTQSGSLKIGSGQGANMKATDIGFNVTLGYRIKQHFLLRARYQMGMQNMIPSGDADNSVKTSTIGITLGYTFGACRSQGSGSPFRIHGGEHWRGMSKAHWSRRDRHPRYPQ